MPDRASETIRGRFDRYHPDNADEAELRRRAEPAGRTVGQQIAYDEGWGDGWTTAVRLGVVAELDGRVRRLHGPGPYSRFDRFGVSQPVDPLDEDRS